MSDLAILQARMAQGLLSGCYDAFTDTLAAGLVAPGEALDIHRNTATGCLIEALRLSYPTVLALVGEDFFDQTAMAFVKAHPPASPWLTGYGSDFAAFLAADVGAGDLPYLPDVARLDLALETVAADAVGQDGLQLDVGGALLILDASLRVIELDYPAAAIRDAIEDDSAALGGIDITPCRHALALWRAPGGAKLRPIGCTAFAFLSALFHGDDIEAAISPGDPSEILSDVFTAPFARVTLMESGQ
jgi:hypothetical protein